MTLQGEMRLRIWDVEHGACAMLHHQMGNYAGRLAMIDSGCTSEWWPSLFIRYTLNRTRLDYLFITNPDQDHMSDLKGLQDTGIYVPVLFRNPTYTGEEMRRIKLRSGPLTNDADWYVQACGHFNQPVSEPFNSHMGGITASVFFNSYPTFKDTNNLSLVVFIRYGSFQIVFPADLELAGWEELLKRQDFRYELAATTVFVASHHGRENGYREEVFNYCWPRVIVMSDKAIVHDTQGMTNTYRQRVMTHHPDGVLVATSGKRRHVLTTRKDGHIQFNVNGNGDFRIETEHQG